MYYKMYVEPGTYFIKTCVVFLGPIPISVEKFQDLQCLKKFCGDEATRFFDTLKAEEKKNKKKSL